MLAGQLVQPRRLIRPAERGSGVRGQLRVVLGVPYADLLLFSALLQLLEGVLTDGFEHSVTGLVHVWLRRDQRLLDEPPEENE